MTILNKFLLDQIANNSIVGFLGLEGEKTPLLDNQQIIEAFKKNTSITGLSFRGLSSDQVRAVFKGLKQNSDNKVSTLYLECLSDQLLLEVGNLLQDLNLRVNHLELAQEVLDGVLYRLMRSLSFSQITSFGVSNASNDMFNKTVALFVIPNVNFLVIHKNQIPLLQTTVFKLQNAKVEWIFVGDDFEEGLMFELTYKNSNKKITVILSASLTPEEVISVTNQLDELMSLGAVNSQIYPPLEILPLQKSPGFLLESPTVIQEENADRVSALVLDVHPANVVPAMVKSESLGISPYPYVGTFFQNTPSENGYMPQDYNMVDDDLPKLPSPGFNSFLQ